jgi:hypothetical protein
MTLSRVALGLLLASSSIASGCTAGSDQPAADPDPTVWVDTARGMYSCNDPRYPQTPDGRQLAVESDARAKGYTARAGETCGDGTATVRSDSALAALGVTPLPTYPGPQVWVNTASGIYHCPTSAYYEATKVGKLMRERDADSAGYTPARGERCS